MYELYETTVIGKRGNIGEFERGYAKLTIHVVGHD